MTLPFVIDGTAVVIPGIYDVLRVQDSLPAPAPAGRSVFVIGEATGGIPGNLLDIQKNYFTSYNDVLSFYKSGPIVDAARQLFATQPSAAFTGSVARLYPWKTNQSTLASKTIASPANYGKISAAEYGEQGNFIKTQILSGQSEALPSVTFNYLPTSASRSVKLSVNGTLSAAATVAADQPASALVTAINALSAGVTASGGTAHAPITGGPAAISLASPSAGILVLTTSVGTWGATVAAGDTCYIIPAGLLAGAANANAGAYLVQSVTSTVLTLKHLKSVGGASEQNTIAFDLTAVPSATASDIVFNAPVTLTQTSTAGAGAGASLEIVPQGSPENWAAGSLYQPGRLVDIVSANTAAVASLTATVPAANQLQVTITGGSFTKTPAAGDTVWIDQSSLLAAGGAIGNHGAYVVVTASAQSLTLEHAYNTTTTAVATTLINASTGNVLWSPAISTTDQAGKLLVSSAEATVWVQATRSTDNSVFTPTRVGGRVGLALSYWDGVATAATASIDSNRVLTLTFTGGPATIKVNTKKYPTLGDLAAYLNTVTGLSATVADASRRADPTRVLDMASVSILSGTATPTYAGRIKTDYSDWVALFSNNAGFISFTPNAALVLKAGLPDAEAVASFLAGATLGSTSPLDIQQGYDAALDVDTRVVVPLFSRDAAKDIEDGITDPNSAYSIDAVHAAGKAHAALASSTAIESERFVVLSHYGTFADSVSKTQALGYERLQMTFQLARATASDGSLQWFLPWMLACAITAGRAQAIAATPMLRKSFNVLDVKHIGDTSLYDDSLVNDFSPGNKTQLSEAIQAGLLTFKVVSGTGVQLASPDLSTRSRNNDPKGWVYERVNVLFGLDEVRQGLRSVLDNLIGNRTTDVSTTDVRKLTGDTLNSYQQSGVLIKSAITEIKSLGNGYTVAVDLYPPEALEFIGITETAKRTVG